MKPQNIGFFAMGVGATGIVIPCLVLAGHSAETIQMAIMISGALIFGCGTIATVIALKK
jgi:hypothetical protein